jgi:DnaJ like chaperone protein
LNVLKYLLFIVTFLFVKLFSWLFKGTRKTIDVGVDAFQSVRNSESFEEAYRNFSSNKFSKARLSVPEEIIALMAKVAASDGKVSELEVEYMSDTIKSIAQGSDQEIWFSVPHVIGIDSKCGCLFYIFWRENLFAQCR